MKGLLRFVLQDCSHTLLLNKFLFCLLRLDSGASVEPTLAFLEYLMWNMEPLSQPKY